jgi:hypothetical protein
MFCQHIITRETHITYPTSVGFLTSVRPHVQRLGTRLEAFATHVTGIRLLGRVDTGEFLGDIF